MARSFRSTRSRIASPGEVVSREFCGGPHVASLEELRGRRFQIVREQPIASGIRRIKAVLV